MSNNKPYLELDYDSISKDYPLSVKGIAKWLVSRKDVKENLQALLDDYKQDPEELFGERIVPMLVQHDGRKLFDYFDHNKIYINTTWENDMWLYFNNLSTHSSTAENRIEAEEKAIIEAFDLLENRLKASRNGL